MSEILSFSEDSALAFELATAATALGSATGRTASSVFVDSPPAAAPSGHVLVLKSGSQLRGDSDMVAAALAQAAKAKGADVVLVGATKLGRQVAAKLGVATASPVLGDVKELKFDSGSLSGARGVFAGRFTARVLAPVPCIAIVPRGSYQAALPAQAEVEEMTVSVLPGRVSRVERRPKTRESVDLRTAKIIVAAGRGFKNKEDLALAENLAKALGGALGASRPLSSDLGWLGEEHHVGLTGIYVRPDLYIAVGISGQLQHVAGIKDSKVIVAINKDKQAPIFQVADYGIVGDLYKVLPAMLAALGS